MKRVCASILILITQWAIIGSVKAAETEQNTIQYLYEKCASTEPIDNAYCAGYISGVAGSMLMASNVMKLHDAHFNLGWCSESTVTVAQMMQAFKNWHDKHPTIWGKDQALGVIGAMQETWPCKSY
jgi:hypothetical protein